MKPTAIDLFCGAGGLSLGLTNAGFNILMHLDNDKNAASTLKYNMPQANVVNEDIKYTDFTTPCKIDLVAAGFPCQPFSYAGNGYGFNDARGTLFWEVARYINNLQPKIVLLENVRGITTHDNGKTLKVILGVLSELGYESEYKILNVVNYDVPQKRERMILIAVKKYSGYSIVFPKMSNHIISLREALHGVPASEGLKYSESKLKVLEQVPEGGYWKDLPVDIQKQYMGKSFYSSGGKTGIARRLSWDDPCLTLTCSPAQKQTERCHPSETRPLTVREYARIQTFPDTYAFCGSITSQYRQIGNAVPVKFAEKIGESLIAILNQ